MVDPGPVLPADVMQEVEPHGVLDSPWVWQVLAVATVLLGCVLLRRGRVRKIHLFGHAMSVPRAGTALALTVMFLLTCTAWLNSRTGFVRGPHEFSALLGGGTGSPAPPAQGAARATGNDVPAPARPTRYEAPKPARPVPTQEATAATQESGTAMQIPQQDSTPRPSATTPTPLSKSPATDNSMHTEWFDLPDEELLVPSGRTIVLLPPGYDDPANAEQRYPVIYLVHDYPSGSPDDWFTEGGAQEAVRRLLDHRLMPKAIVVGVDVRAGQDQDWECLDTVDGPQLESYLAGTVVRAIDERYRTAANRGDRALGGMAGGAFCALNVGLKHLDQFSVLLGSLPYDNPGDADVLLGDRPDLVTANSPVDYLRDMPFPFPVAVMLHGGTGDPETLEYARRDAELLQQRGQVVALRVDDGQDHSWRTARAGLPYLLAFAGKHLTPVA